MSTHHKTRKPNFWIVIFGLFLLISVITAGTYALNEFGLISPAAMSGGEGGAPPNSTTGELLSNNSSSESDAFNLLESMPGDRHGDTPGGSITGFAKAIGQLAVVITLVYYAQKLLGWLERRLHKQAQNRPYRMLDAS